ncbi:MAG: AI-2E family transporter [Fimbriimonadaceae bacterium]
MSWRMALWILLVGAFFAFLYLVRAILMPFILALLVAAVLEPVIQRSIKKRAGQSVLSDEERSKVRKRSVLSIWGLTMLGLTLVVVLLTPQVSRQILTFKDRIEGISAQLSAQTAYDNYFIRWNPRIQMESNRTTGGIDSFFESNTARLKQLGLPTSRRAAMSEYVEPHRKEFTKAIQTFFGGILGIVSAFGSKALLLMFTPIFALLMLLDTESMKGRAASLIPPSIRNETLDLLADIADVFTRYIRGVSIALLIYSVIAAVVLTILGVPYGLVLAFVFPLIYLIPYLGSAINVGIIVLITGISGQNSGLLFSAPSPWTYGAIAGLIYFIIFLIFDQVVYTPVVGKSVGLHPLVSFFVVFAGGSLFGPMGMILAFPTAGAVKIILDRLITVTSKTQDLQLPSIPLRHRDAVH